MKYKLSKCGVKIPVHCPQCKSTKTCLITYLNGDRSIECNNCYTVLKNLKNKKVK